jgi:hypothetical protein
VEWNYNQRFVVAIIAIVIYQNWFLFTGKAAHVAAPLRSDAQPISPHPLVMRRFVPIPPRTVPDSWDDSDEEEEIVVAEPPKPPSPKPEPPKPTIQLLKRTTSQTDSTDKLSLSTQPLLMMDNSQRQDHYAKTREKIFSELGKAPAINNNKSKVPLPPALRARDSQSEQDPDFSRDMSLYSRRFDPGFGLVDDGRGEVRPQKTYESEFPDALPRRWS